MSNKVRGRKPDMSNFKMLLVELLKESNFQNDERKAVIPAIIPLCVKHHVGKKAGMFIFDALKKLEIIKTHRDGTYSITNKRDYYTNKPFSVGNPEKVQAVYNLCREMSSCDKSVKEASIEVVETPAEVPTTEETIEKPTFTTEELVAMLEEKGYEVSIKHIYKLV